MEFLLLFGLLLLAITLGSWWLGRRFWQQSSESELTSPPSFRTLAELVLLASLLNLLLYGVTAVFLLPWSQGGAHGQPPTPDDWQEAHLTHEFWLLLLSGICGALFLRTRRGRAAALSWLTGCVVVIVGFRGLGIYQGWVDKHQSLALVQSSWLMSESRGLPNAQPMLAPGLTHQITASVLGADLCLFRHCQGLYAQPSSCFFRHFA